MTGIVAVLGSIAPNIVYSAGLYTIAGGSGVDLSPIDTPNYSSYSSVINVSWEWIGYYKSSTTQTITVGVICNYAEYDDGIPFTWGGGGTSTGYVWTDATAKSGYNSGNALVSATNGSGTNTKSVIAGIYYPIRIQWSTALPRQSNIFIGTRYAESNFTFTVNGSSDVSGGIFYNSISSGF